MSRRPKPKVDADGTYHCPCGAFHRRGPVNGVNAYRCLMCGHVHAIKGQLPKHLKEMSLVVNLKQMTLDQLEQLKARAGIEFNLKEIDVLEEMTKVVRGHMRPGAVLWRVDQFNSDKWTITQRRTKNTVWYKHSLSTRGTTAVRYLNLRAATYSVFTNVTMIKRNGKVVYRRYDFLRKHKATCLKRSWALK